MPLFALIAVVLAATVQPAVAAPCAADIAVFQKLLDSDLKVGHVAKSVHAKAVADLAPAKEACKAGNEAGATATLRSVRARYGYPP